MVILTGAYQEKYMLYIPSANRRRWAKFREHLENEGKRVNEVIMELVDGYMKFKEGTDDE